MELGDRKYANEVCNYLIGMHKCGNCFTSLEKASANGFFGLQNWTSQKSVTWIILPTTLKLCIFFYILYIFIPRKFPAVLLTNLREEARITCIILVFNPEMCDFRMSWALPAAKPPVVVIYSDSPSQGCVRRCSERIQGLEERAFLIQGWAALS